ncbi:MAG: hypothetical protein WBO58_00435 [Gammaproteobacteria bacterium]
MIKNITMERVIQRLAMASVLGLLGAPVAATDLTFNAYIGIPLGGGSPFAGVSTRRDIGSFSHDFHGSPQPSHVKLDLRFSPKGGTVLSLNDIALTQSPVRHASDDGVTKSDQGYTNWQYILGAALGVGLIVAIVDSDTTVKICSGPNCPPEEEPPAMP